MSVLRQSEGPNSTSDNADSEEPPRSSRSQKPTMVKTSDSFESVLSNEILNPQFEKLSVFVESPERHGLNPLLSTAALESIDPKLENGAGGETLVERKIDQEIEEVEMEITRLTSRLQALKMEKAEKFIPPKRRGLSLGPLRKQEIITTPVLSIQNRRRSCVWKLRDINEESMSKGRGKTMSLSPKSRKSMANNQASRKAVSTVASMKIAKKDDEILNSIQPTKLFRDAGISSSKPQRAGKVVASRYKEIFVQPWAVRKRSLQENGKNPSLSTGKSRVTHQSEKKNMGAEIRVKRKPEILTGNVVHKDKEP